MTHSFIHKITVNAVSLYNSITRESYYATFSSLSYCACFLARKMDIHNLYEMNDRPTAPFYITEYRYHACIYTSSTESARGILQWGSL